MSEAMHRSFVKLAAAGAILVGAAPLAAAPCQTLPSPVYVSGSSLLLPLVAAMSTALSASPAPITVVFQGSSSCAAVSAFTTAEQPSLTGTGRIWDGTGVQSTCDLGTGFPSDVGVSDLFPATCGRTSLAVGVSEQLGPVDALAFVVPRASQASSISSGAAYMVYGFGAQSSPLIQPWRNPSTLLHFASDSPTQLMLGLGIGVPAAKWLPSSNSLASTSTMVAAMVSSSSPDSTIGILTSDVADTQRSVLKELAYQDAGQSCAYWPDSTSTAADKQNVRDGHYPLWGRSHFFFRSTADGTPISANVAIVLDLINGSASLGALNVVQVEAASGLVPDCAMRVTRSAEMAPLQSYMPEASCACYFAALTGTTPSTCNPCMTNNECSGSTPVCHFGFCEIK
jgi:hypothetical protein